MVKLLGNLSVLMGPDLASGISKNQLEGGVHQVEIQPQLEQIIIWKWCNLEIYLRLIKEVMILILLLVMRTPVVGWDQPPVHNEYLVLELSRFGGGFDSSQFKGGVSPK